MLSLRESEKGNDFWDFLNWVIFFVGLDDLVLLHFAFGNFSSF